MTNTGFETVRSEFLRLAQARGYLHQCTDTDALDAALLAGPVSTYVGYDLTADSLHVGHLVSIMLLRLWQRCGHRPVVLMGGGTTKIGDPSGRDESRRLLSDEQIAVNKAGIRRSFDPFLRFGDGASDAIEADNAAWLDALAYIPLLREVGVHFSVNRMLSMDSVRLRLDRDQPLTFLEFNYMILQSYDFRELSRRLGVAVQMGGSDQWGNIIMGADLIRRTDQRAAFGLTVPLLATASGAKMGKTAAGAVWLNPDRLAPFGYWQFWRNTEDADVPRFLRLFTEIAEPEIARLAALGGSEINQAKIILATEATALLHGREASDAAARAATGGEDGGLPVVTIPELAAGMTAFALVARAFGLASNAEARRHIRGGAVRLDDVAVADEARMIDASGFKDGAARLSLGRRQHVMVRVG